MPIGIRARRQSKDLTVAGGLTQAVIGAGGKGAKEYRATGDTW